MTIADLANGDDDALFAELMRRGGEKAVNQYKHNDMMMNFQCIPDHLREGFLATSAAKFSETHAKQDETNETKRNTTKRKHSTKSNF